MEAFLARTMVSEITQQSVLALAESRSRDVAARCRMLFDLADRARTVTEAFRETLACHELTEIGLSVLAVLAARDAATPEEVAREARLPKRTACHALAQLELAGLLVFRRDPNHGARPRVQCTPAGRRTCAGTLRACLDTALDLTADLDPGQAEDAADAVQRIGATDKSHSPT